MSTKNAKEAKGLDSMRIHVKLSALSDIMFDRFIDHSKEVRPPEQKLYLAEGNRVVLPAENINTFLFGEAVMGCAKTFEGKRGKLYIQMGMSHIFPGPALIPFLDGDNKPIIFKGFDNGHYRIDYTAGRTKQGTLSIKQEAKPRPVLLVPWALEFYIDLVKNDLIDETKLYNWFVRGGMQIAIGTFRPRFGRFTVEEWGAEEK